MEADKIKGILLSLKCVRTRQVSSYILHNIYFCLLRTIVNCMKEEENKLAKEKKKKLPCGESNPGHGGESAGS